MQAGKQTNPRDGRSVSRVAEISYQKSSFQQKFIKLRKKQEGMAHT